MLFYIFWTCYDTPWPESQIRFNWGGYDTNIAEYELPRLRGTMLYENLEANVSWNEPSLLCAELNYLEGKLRYMIYVSSEQDML